MSVQLRSGALRDAHAAAVVVATNADARRLVVLGVDDRHVGDVDGTLLLDHSHGRIRAAGHGALVALDDVHALHVHAVSLGLGAQHLARAALVLARDDDHGVVRLDLHAHSTSGASETMR